MKNLFYSLVVIIGLTSCGGSSESTTINDSTTVDTTKIDTCKVDSCKKDSIK